MKRPLIAAALVLLIGGAGLGTYVYRHREAAPPQYQGWVEADLVFVSPDEEGRITNLAVREGATVNAGSPLFTLDDDLQRAAVSENEAAVVNARQTYDRAKVLLKQTVGTQKAFDDAEAALRSAEARLNSAKTRLDRRTRFSPVAGTIQEVYFRTGEVVQSGRPIVSILPPENIKVRFFVPQDRLPAVHIGAPVLIRCDGCADDLNARVSFISAQAEFTPPVIYSLEERARLVFRIEAIPERPADVRIGQPASVALVGTAQRETAHADR
ncbi:efflux RND transporter periplasmic adaptor subunit [Hyphomicrobium sp.]|uniref:HlyD family secretion protein n=1 Tax=Hyphomicrobium sp. TaxID=82 RepID=UPI0025C68D30|nr:efflux RND transporter periplasmic adaptor subunit [Hyphomicrobium sp.]MCC7254041.1 efflux RND transporter periplasmic adaptor subunit [Hyphomicrobium sp.]